MQPIDQPGYYVAEWGAFAVHLDVRAGRCLVEIRRRADGAVLETMTELPRRTATEAIEWAAAWLMAHGCQAFVDGEARSLAPFLSFVEECNSEQ